MKIERELESDHSFVALNPKAAGVSSTAHPIMLCGHYQQRGAEGFVDVARADELLAASGAERLIVCLD